MEFFDENDPFDSIMNQFFGNGRKNQRQNFINGEEEERVIDFIETEDSFYLILEIPGFSEDDVSVNVNMKSIEINARKKEFDKVKEYLLQKLSSGFRYKSKLPDFIDIKGFRYSLKNGIFEIKFRRKK